MTPIGQKLRRLLLLALFLPPLAAGCSSLTTTHATPTAQIVCDDFERGAAICEGGDFDKEACLNDMPCHLGLYRTEVVNLILSCGDRLNEGLCPAQKGYFCDEKQDRDVLAALTLSPTGNDFVRAFEAKATTCQMAGITLRPTLYDSALYLRERIFSEARSCLDGACEAVSDCLTGATLRVAPFCP